MDSSHNLYKSPSAVQWSREAIGQRLMRVQINPKTLLHTHSPSLGGAEALRSLNKSPSKADQIITVSIT